MNKEYRRVVVKVGTNTLTDESGALDRAYIADLARQIAELKARGVDVLLVTSGAIRAGVEGMKLGRRPRTIPEKQAAASVGQGILMHDYADSFGQHGVTTGQVLLTREDFGDRRRYLNARNTMLTLFSRGIVPIVNENDTVSVEEIRLGDNDTLAALVAASLEADLLIILSDVDGLYDGMPGRSANAKLIPVVTKIDHQIKAIAGESANANGTGGMRTKIEAAQIAMTCGVTMVVAHGRQANVIQEIVAGEQHGTFFLPKEERLCSRKQWIAFGMSARGSVTVNDGAKKMIADGGKSLLAAGITEVSGRFMRGDLVRVLDGEGNQFARGFVNYSAGEIEKILGLKSSEIENVLGYKDFDEVIHRDNLVLGI